MTLCTHQASVCACAYVYVHMCVEATGQCWMSSLIALYIIIFDKSLT